MQKPSHAKEKCPTRKSSAEKKFNGKKFTKKKAFKATWSDSSSSDEEHSKDEPIEEGIANFCLMIRSYVEEETDKEEDE